jgi:broad specificity phosphatase PhoE
MLSRIYLIRRGETDWSLSGWHTGHTDLPLTAHGEKAARELGQRLHDIPFTHVLTSPRHCSIHPSSNILTSPVCLTDRCISS